MDLLLRHKRNDACCAAHCLTEVYATLTATSATKRVTPVEAVLYLGTLRERLTCIALDGEITCSLRNWRLRAGRLWQYMHHNDSLYATL